jgi:hypothetical protein
MTSNSVNTPDRRRTGSGCPPPERRELIRITHDERTYLLNQPQQTLYADGAKISRMTEK